MDSAVPGGYVAVGVYAERLETERDRYREALNEIAAEAQRLRIPSIEAKALFALLSDV